MKKNITNAFALIGGYAVLKKIGELLGDDCPRATKDIKLNTRNRQICIDEYNYMPPNPSLPNTQYWVDYAKKWLKGRQPTQQQVEDFKTMRCWNCAAFDISPRMLACLPPVTESDNYDLQGMTKNTVFGYCHMHQFKCRSERTCYTWAGSSNGKPIMDDETSKNWQK